jgi:uncharacterized membrane protein YiaA
MKNNIEKGKSSKNDTLSYFIVLILGILSFLIGLFAFKSKLFGVRGFGVVMGLKAEIGGIALILVGLYVIIFSIRKLISRKKYIV